MNIKTETDIKQFEKIKPIINDFAISIIDTIHEPFLLLNKDKTILYANKKFFDNFKVTFNEIIGKRFYNIGDGQWDIPELRMLLDEFSREKNDFKCLEIEQDFPTIGHKILILNARMIRFQGETSDFIFIAIEDITERRIKENELKEYEARYKRQFDTAHDGLLLINYTDGRIVNSNSAVTSMLGYSAEDFDGKSLQDVGLIDNVEFQKVLLNLKDIGFVYFDNILAKTKEGRTINIELYLVDRTELIQCNVRDIKLRKKTENELRIYHENLAEMVKKRTEELENKIHDLETFNKAFVDRELRMIELKKIIAELNKEVASLNKTGLHGA